MKKIVQLSTEYAGMEIAFNPYLNEGVVAVLTIMEVSDLPETIGVKVWYGNDYMDTNSVELPRDAFVNLVRYMTANDHKINAIKLVRAATHWGLKESKDFVESL